VNISAAEVPETVRPWLPLAERLGRLWVALARELPTTLHVDYEGGLAEFDTRILTLAVLKGLFSVATDEPVSYVNAPQLAEERGLEVRSTNASGTREYVNVITLRGGAHAVAGTMFGGGEPKVVMVDDHEIELPIARWMLVVRNDDRIGMVAAVATILAEAKLNILDLRLGRTGDGATAMMALSFDQPVPSSVVEQLTATPGILDAVALADV
jgi:D-3-phosphoglycerate dehydrogenase